MSLQKHVSFGENRGEENPRLGVDIPEDMGALVLFGRPSRTLKYPGVEPTFGSGNLGGQNGALAPPPIKEPEHGSQGRLLGKSSAIFPEPTLQTFEVSPEVLAVLKGAKQILDWAGDSGDRRSEFLIEEPREKEPRKHSREIPSESSTPPTKRPHESDFDPVQEDTDCFENLKSGKRGKIGGQCLANSPIINSW